MATLLIWGGIEFRTVILWTLLPGLLAACSIFFFTRDREASPISAPNPSGQQSWRAFPRTFWIFGIGVFLFGLGDFSRTFLIWIATQQFGGPVTAEAGAVSVAVLLYTFHNLVSAGVAYPVGHIGDRGSKIHILLWGYVLGVGTNLLLALMGNSVGWLIGIVVLSGTYIAIEETLEKAVAAEMLPRELRSLGFGFLACANAVGDMASSLYVGYLLENHQAGWAFGIAASVGLTGVLWLVVMLKGPRRGSAQMEGNGS
jgi:MFS family permease